MTRNDDILLEDIRRARLLSDDIDTHWAWQNPEKLGPDFICWFCRQPSLSALCDSCDVRANQGAS